MTPTPTPAANPVIQLRQVQKSFANGDNRLQVLFDIDLDLYGGEMTLVVGPSGCGKTTLISIIAGILNADSGQINLFGTRLDTLPDGQKTAFRKQHVGFIFQQFNLLPTMTVLENVAVPLFISGVPKPQALARAAKVLEAVELSDRAHYLPANISGGQQQRVAIGRALVRAPSLIICDEPTASLDGATGSKILTLLRQVAVQPGRCVIVVTHDNRILPFADRMVSMEDGRIQQVQAIAPNSNPPHPLSQGIQA